MTTAWVLMTAMPPTKGHANLIEFASNLDAYVNVIVCTQPDEPFAGERFIAVNRHFRNISNVHVHWLQETLPQDPNTDGFWELWEDILTNGSNHGMLYYGVDPGDYIVSSEAYGETLAQRLDAIFMPYDPDRELYYTKATNVREYTTKYFHDILPEFQDNLRTNVVIFGAESTGKTTLSKELSYKMNGHWLFEWARPYLETVGSEINVDSMTAIHRGQRAIQDHSHSFFDKPYAIFDTDLFSTVGYWAQPHWEKELGKVPEELIRDAVSRTADLYIITKSNIPFEEDVIRYGGDHRESDDNYWIALCEQYSLPYVVLQSSDFDDRVQEAAEAVGKVSYEKVSKIFYDRGGF